MIQGVYSGNSVLSKVLIFIGLLLTGFGVSTLLGLTFSKSVLGLDVFSQPHLLTDFSNPNSIIALKFMQMLHTLGIFILPVLVFAYFVSNKWKSYLGFNSVTNGTFFLLTAIIMVMSAPIINLLVKFNEGMQLPEFLYSLENWMREKENGAKVITESFLKMETPLSFMTNLFVIGFLPAVGEELLFRGLIQRQLTNRTGNHHLAVWTAAILFSAMHMQFYGFLPRLLLGVVFGYLFVWSGSLWVPMLAHFINNAGAVTVQYIYGEEFVEAEVDTFGIGEGDWIYVLPSIIVVGYTIFFAWRIRLKEA